MPTLAGDSDAVYQFSVPALRALTDVFLRDSKHDCECVLIDFTRVRTKENRFVLLMDAPFYESAVGHYRRESSSDTQSNFPKDQFYRPPEHEPDETKIIGWTSDRVVRLETYPFSKVEATYQVEPDGTLGKPLKREWVALKSNPYYFGSDIYAPKSIEQGGPFTIGRVIHSNRHATLSAWIGGVAVFDRALSDDEMKRLATIGNCSVVVQ